MQLLGATVAWWSIGAVLLWYRSAAVEIMVDADAGFDQYAAPIYDQHLNMHRLRTQRDRSSAAA